MGSAFSNLITRSPLDPTGAYEWDYQVNGYWFINFTSLPSILSSTNVNTQILALCTTLQLPELTIQASARAGMGGIHVNVPTSIQSPSTITIGFYDIVPNGSASTTLQYLTQWANSIRNIWTGTADPTNALTPNQYKCTAVFVATDPTITIPILGLKLFGLWPTQSPWSNYNAEMGNSDMFQYSVNFSVDRVVPIDGTNSDVANLLTAAQTYVQGTAVTVPATLP
jgi:hypothetical protein